MEFMETFSGKNLSEEMLYHALTKIFRLLHSYTRISYILCEITYDCQACQVKFRFLPKTEVAVDRCSMKKLFQGVFKNSQGNKSAGISI